ncbi:mycofactocin oligosaccharide methyltransferase MftM [Antrihabitans sp. YC2-6]|uniref:mycofactocin oligosaccharide methyltransferase MftM n=1 Tax=Antrihabitans sp. YC2-6 TaxID=2799498 RepID=UPI0018F424D5|nr:mycofactocin oligosaccharide methyltransferase MftM [Antrihabitans sp. YC2-6]MBJ8348012.1 class I SAM-dependent methyltransferase [Antrihabitans sp. YC2-6]
MLDPIAPSPPGRWHGDHVEVVRLGGVRSRTITATRGRRRLTVRHALRPGDLSDGLAIRVADELALEQRSDFEAVMVGLIRSTVDDPVCAWAEFYRNSLQDLLSGAAAFSPVHERAEQLVAGASVVDLGSCFGFFAIRLARTGLTVTATDICASTMRLLARVAPELDCSLDTLACDAASVPLPDNHADTVTAIHLLEHVDTATGALILAEAVRVARRRVVVAVPFETTPTACHGHVRTFDVEALRAMGDTVGCRFAVTEYHGGWLVLDL